MSPLKKYPLFVALLGIGGIVALGEGWLIFDRVRAAHDAAATYAKKQAELQAMAGFVPAPTRAVAAAIESDLARAQRALETMRAELKGRGPAAERLRTAKAPAARTDAYFDLAAFVEKTREQAKAQEIDVKPEAARFGFSIYANEGPETERIAPVFHQRLIAQYLVEALIEAKPRSLLAVRREPPLTKKEKEDRDAASAAAAGGGAPAAEAAAPALPEGPDFFAIDPRASARVPGYLDTTAFKLTFVGQTAALRTFLNKLASFELAVLVREVEVEPAAGADLAIENLAGSEDAASASASAPASVVLRTEPAVPKSGPKSNPKAPGVAPIVAKPWCKFTVTVEYIELVSPATTVADAAAQPEKPTT